MKKILILFYLIIYFTLIGISNSTIGVGIKNYLFHNVGRKGTLLFRCSTTSDFFDSIEDIGKTVSFTDKLKNPDNQTQEYTLNCGFWKEKNSTNLYYFCNVNETIPAARYYVQFNQYVKYRDTEIHIGEGVGVIFHKNDSDYIDLYSVEKQTVTISDEISGDNKYTFKFNIVSYHEEKVFLKVQTYLPMDCQKNETDGLLYCSIEKRLVNGQIKSESDNIRFYHLNSQQKLKEFYLVPSIKIKIDKKEKQDVYVGVSKLLTPYSGHQGLIVYDTNVTDFPYIYTDTFKQNFSFVTMDDAFLNCSFIKLKSSPLRIICRKSQSWSLRLTELKNERILDDLSYKYNFRIQPHNISERIYQLDYDYNSYIYWINQDHFDFQNRTRTSYTIDIVGNYSRIAYQNHVFGGVRFNENDEVKNLECEYFENLKKCVVPLEHFNGLKNGEYYIRHETNQSMWLTSYETEPIKVTLPTLNISIQEIFVDKIGKKGTIIFKTFVQEFASVVDTKKKELFEETIINKADETKKYNVTCGFWKGEIIGNVSYVFCNVDESVPEGDYRIQFINNTFFYLYYEIVLSSDQYNFKKTNEEIIDINSGIQVLNLSDTLHGYNLKFKISAYYGEKIFLKINTNTLLTCSSSNTTNMTNATNELNCSIDKYKLENQVQNENQELSLSYVDHRGYHGTFNLVDKIKIVKNEIKKEDIFIGITKLLTPTAELGGNIAYDTNVTNLSYTYTAPFEMSFDGIDKNITCNFVKTNENLSLKMICTKDKYAESPLSLKGIDNEKILDKINYKYNYRIQPAQIKEKFTLVNTYTNHIFYVYPDFFNFTEKTSFLIEIFGDFTNTTTFEGIGFSEKSTSNLVCENIGVIKKCNITKEHFDGVNTGYFYLNHQNGNKTKFPSYEVAPIKAILEIFIYVDTVKAGEIGRKGTFLFSGYCPETIAMSLTDTEKKEIFNATIVDEKDENKTYTINCGLWKFRDDLYTFCDADEKVPKGEYFVKFDEIIFYHEYKLYLQSEKLKIKKIDEDVADVYAEPQVIKIDEEPESNSNIILKFKINSYNGQKMFLYVNYIIPLDCSVNKDELVCSLDKNDLKVQVISQYTKVAAISENAQGNLNYLSLVPLEFNYTSEKIPVYVDLVKSLKRYIWTGEYFTYETNVTDVQPLITDDFKLNFRSSKGRRTFNCKFIKPENTALKLICRITEFLSDPDLAYIENEIVLDNIYYKYIFRIQQCYHRAETNARKNKYQKILGMAPSVLDFSKKSEHTIEIFFDPHEPSGNLSRVTFNESDVNLNCDYYRYVMRCKVPKKHFSVNGTAYYYLFHSFTGDTSKYISYELFPMKVIFATESSNEEDKKNDEGKNNNNIGNKGFNVMIPITILIVAVLIGVVIYICLKRREKKGDKTLLETLGKMEKQEMF